MAGSNIPVKNTLFEVIPSLLVRSDFSITDFKSPDACVTTNSSPQASVTVTKMPSP